MRTLTTALLLRRLHRLHRLPSASAAAGFLPPKVRPPPTPTPSFFSSSSYAGFIPPKVCPPPTPTPEIPADLASLHPTLRDLDIHNPAAVDSALLSLSDTPAAARRLFSFLSALKSPKPRSQTHNIMLQILASTGATDDFWSLLHSMKPAGHSLEKSTFLKACDSLTKNDAEKLKQMYSYFLKTDENLKSVPRGCPVICDILRGDEGEIWSKLEDAGVRLSTDLVLAVLERMAPYPKKASLFFQWVEGEDNSFRVDARVYNAMAKVLGREECIDELSRILRKMRDGGYGLETDTYVKVLGRFLAEKMIGKAVDLYEFAMGGEEKLSTQDFVFVLKKVVVSKGLDLDLVSRVVRIYVHGGNTVDGSAFKAAFKSLRSVERLGECDKVLKAMESGGFVADTATYVRVVMGLCAAGRLSEAREYVDSLEMSGSSADVEVWTTLVQMHSQAGELDSAIWCFRKLVDKKGGEKAGPAFDALVNCLCKAKKVEGAFKILKETVTKKDLKPWHSTYKFLIKRLLSYGKVKKASTILGSMKSQGFPPFIDPFIDYISKAGTLEDVMGFLKAATSDKVPSRYMFIRIFEALLKAGRHDLAHNVLSEAPDSVSNHEDVSSLFYSLKLDKTDVAAAV